jgi:hypothetical protein
MKRSLINLTVDIVAAVSLLVMILTGYILRFPLPPSTNRTYELWGMSRHEWGTIHAWAGAWLVGVILLHLILHWDWIFTMVRRRFTSSQVPPNQSRRIGLITAAALIATGGIFAWVTQTSVRVLETPRHPLNRPIELDETPSNQTAISQVIGFQRDIWPIFEAACMRCHGPGKAHSNFRVDRRESFFAEPDTEPLIVPGNSEKSRLIAIVSGEVRTMKSAEYHLLPSRELALLKTWINTGADWEENK